MIAVITGSSKFPDPVPAGTWQGMDLSKRRSGRSDTGQRFVIQHHAARDDYYQFGLEIDGVLVSWAIPRESATDPREAGMARRAGDHPLESAESQVWDQGTYANRTDHEMSTCLGRGHLALRLHGEKFCGRYGLTRIREGDEETWLLLKRGDDGADARRNPVRGRPESLPIGSTPPESP